MNSFFVRNPDVMIREEGPDGALLFNPDTNHIKILNATSFVIWQLCDGSHDVNAIIGAIKAQFDTVPDDATLHDDVMVVINGMLQSQFLGEQTA